MNPYQIARNTYDGLSLHLAGWQEDRLIAAITAALQDETKACAKVAEEYGETDLVGERADEHWATAYGIATAIRSRKAKP